ncbi:unnamed protein product [Arabis nemorensis]|uniref:Uncharacterized protein n=1 Tax=Arabis nemorensis TaxID=586526 RepID=A0A565BJE6_9BRAS|nr:unnamed protein product [Arabis nemorensis]
MVGAEEKQSLADSVTASQFQDTNVIQLQELIQDTGTVMDSDSNHERESHETKSDTVTNCVPQSQLTTKEEETAFVS